MQALVFAILAIVVIAVAARLAPKLNIAGPLILVLVGIGVSLLPFVELGEVDPEIILVGILPPLLYSSAVSLPAIEFRRDFGSVFGLSVLLVVVTAVALGFFFSLLVPGLGIALGIAMGAILSPTDAVATGITKRLGISPRVVTLLEGESLLNDATALVLLRTAVAAFVAGSASVGAALGDFAWGVFIAIVVGSVVGAIGVRFRVWIRDSAPSTAVGFVLPFIAYLPTEAFGGSGLVAAVVAGIVVGQWSPRWLTPEQRLSDTLNWRTVELVLEGGVFLLMGLELSSIVDDVTTTGQGLGTAFGLAAGALGIVLVVRAAYVALLVWLQSARARRMSAQQRERLEQLGERLDAYQDEGTKAFDVLTAEDRAFVLKSQGGRNPGSPERRQRRIDSMRTRISRALADMDYYQASPIGWKHGVVIVWAGMRGVVTLAAAQTLPRDTDDRALLVLVAFLVAAGSLMLQGFTLPMVVRWLRLASGGEGAVDREEQRRLDRELRDAAASALRERTLTRRDGSAFAEEMLARIDARFLEPPEEDTAGLTQEMLELRLALIDAMRVGLIEASSGGRYSSATLRHTLAELDADQLSIQLKLPDD